MVGKIATGEMLDNGSSSVRSESARMGGAARAKALSADKRSEIASGAAKARWQSQEAAMNGSECATLAASYEAKRAAGLVDVKFFLNGADRVLHEEVCAEVNRLDEAISDGAYVPLVFDDRHHAS